MVEREEEDPSNDRQCPKMQIWAGTEPHQIAPFDPSSGRRQLATAPGSRCTQQSKPPSGHDPVRSSSNGRLSIDPAMVRDHSEPQDQNDDSRAWADLSKHPSLSGRGRERLAINKHRPSHVHDRSKESRLHIKDHNRVPFKQRLQLKQRDNGSEESSSIKDEISTVRNHQQHN
ncbi:hypothetical protein ACLOJK_006766 [Asimina triloba]